jgi:hypothetical protein
MGNDRSTIIIPSESCAAILDAVQSALIDRYASKATRKAALSALLALIEAGSSGRRRHVDKLLGERQKWCRRGTYQDAAASHGRHSRPSLPLIAGTKSIAAGRPGAGGLLISDFHPSR